MNIFSVALLSIAMSTDAFAAAVGKGTALKNPRLGEALRTGLIFGVIEALTPLIGWAFGKAASGYVESFDHWIAFVLLLCIGLMMLHSAYKGREDEVEVEKPTKNSFLMLALTGFATSIDAMAIGVGLAFVDVPIIPVALAIGFSTFVLVTIGVMIGRWLGSFAGRWAELFGGLLLIGIGSMILYDHLKAA